MHGKRFSRRKLRRVPEAHRGCDALGPRDCCPSRRWSDGARDGQVVALRQVLLTVSRRRTRRKRRECFGLCKSDWSARGTDGQLERDRRLRAKCLYLREWKQLAALLAAALGTVVVQARAAPMCSVLLPRRESDPRTCRHWCIRVRVLLALRVLRRGGARAVRALSAGRVALGHERRLVELP